MIYEELLIEAESIGLCVKETPLPLSDGRIKGKRIAIRQDIPTLAQKACVLAEEIGHYHTASIDILNQNNITNRKLEHAGRLWAYNKQIGLSGIIRGFQHRCQNRHELAEYLQVSEYFLQDALDCYRKKYGNCIDLDNYTIIFEPYLMVIERL